ncbi:glycosyltransferase family 2 protein [Halostella salina]|uniref:glycosyltransferase family 2 protein n=1 Tax=Halostella salina TaxID=1547897 RepID=UPI000EF78089|nr:glycosyltransferase family 2 protein [Halostella salina]
MYEGRTVGVVVPAYNEADHVGHVIRKMPSFVDRIYVVDDASTDNTWEEIRGAAERLNEHGHAEVDRHLSGRGTLVTGGRVIPIRHETNRGVGGAIKTGYLSALADEMDVTAVIAGDDQMDQTLLKSLLEPIVQGRADYAKGNRFLSAEDRENVPRFRLFGNAMLSFLTKVASGYWTISDSQNGYTAISREALESIETDRMYEFYGYCNDILVRLNVAGMTVVDVPLPISYEDESSNINYFTYVPHVSGMLLRNFLWRLKTKYVLRDFHPLVLLYGFGAVGSIAFALQSFNAARSEDGPQLSTTVNNGLVAGLLLVLAMVFDRIDNDHLDESWIEDSEV